MKNVDSFLDSTSAQEDCTCEATSINSITSRSKLFACTSSKPFMLMGGREKQNSGFTWAFENFKTNQVARFGYSLSYLICIRATRTISESFGITSTNVCLKTLY